MNNSDTKNALPSKSALLQFPVLLMALLGATGAGAQIYSLDLSAPPQTIIWGQLDLGGSRSDGSSYNANNIYIEKDGKAIMPVFGEFHYSRYPSQYWEESLRKMKAGGINIVATYVFWNIHEREEGKFDWAGNLDLRRFIELVDKVGLKVNLRIGPFGHGEMRNGGLPDWIYGRPLEVRSNDPLYLDYTDKYYAEIAKQVKGLLFKDGGPIICIQLENEFQHSAAPWEFRYAGSPRENTVAERDVSVTHGGVSVSDIENKNADYGKDHMVNLKLIAKRHGLDVPLYTATGWGNAAIVPKGSIPVTAAYAYPFWNLVPRPSPFYLFKDIRKTPDYSPVSFDTNLYPSVPAELGSGMSVTYARRMFVPEESAEPMIVRMLGSGAAGVGYYMYHGGATPVFDKFYNEDAGGLPKINYDYQAPLGQYGQTREHYNSLRLLHLFLASYGERMAPLQAILPPNNPEIKATDNKNLRYAARGANGSGFIFMLNFQDHVEIRDMENVKLEINDVKRTIPVPSHGTFTLKKGSSAILPINLDLGGTPLRSATVQPLSILRDGSTSRYVFFSIDGLAPELVFDSGAVGDPENCSVSKNNGATVVSGSADECFAFVVDGKPVLVVPRRVALQAVEIDGGRMVFADATVLADGDELTLLSTGKETVGVNVYPATEAPSRVSNAKVEKIMPMHKTMSAFQVTFVPVDYTAVWRKIAPRRYAVRFNTGLGSLNDVFMRVNYIGDAGMAFIDGKMVDDHFYYSRPWEIGLKRFMPQLQGNEMVFVFHAMQKNPTYKNDIAEHMPEFAPDQKSFLDVKGVVFTPEYKTVFKLGAAARATR